VRATGYAVFDTRLGFGAVAWNDHGIVGIRLPEPDEAATRAGVRRRHGSAQEQLPPPTVRAAIDGMIALLDGEPADLSDIVLDLDGVPEPDRRIYALARRVPAGSTATYGELADRLGDPIDAKAVGVAMARNPFPSVVPCHRVVAAGGKLGGFSAPGGADTKRRLLLIEGAAAAGPPTLFD
jgi:methylated-DNA-[protein]-cysteine S-methyltransferase